MFNSDGHFNIEIALNAIKARCNRSRAGCIVNFVIENRCDFYHCGAVKLIYLSLYRDHAMLRYFVQYQAVAYHLLRSGPTATNYSYLFIAS